MVRMGEVEIQGLDLSGFIPVTGKAAGAAAAPRINLLLNLSSSLLSVDQDLLLQSSQYKKPFPHSCFILLNMSHLPDLDLTVKQKQR